MTDYGIDITYNTFDANTSAESESYIIDVGGTWGVDVSADSGAVTNGKINLEGKELSKQYFESIEQRITNLENGGYNNMGLLTTTNILIVMVICIVTVKLVIPNLTLKKVLKAFVRLVYNPGKKAAETVEKEWEEAKRE